MADQQGPSPSAGPVSPSAASPAPDAEVPMPGEPGPEQPAGSVPSEALQRSASATQPSAPNAASGEAAAIDAGHAGTAAAAEAAAVDEEPAAQAARGAGAAVAEEQTAEEQTKPAVTPEPPSDEALVARLRQLLTEVDLSTTTEKQLRRRLEGEYGVELAGRKALLRAEINAYLEAQDVEGEEGEAAEEEAEDDGDAAPSRKRRATGSTLGSYLSPEMQDFLGVQRMPRPQVVKKLWEYIKAHGLQDPKDKRVIVFDDRLKTLFTGTRCNMFKLQKQLSKHCKTSDVVGGSGDEEEEEEEEERPAAKKARPANTSASRRRSGSAGDEGKEKKPNGFTKECMLSSELAGWFGQPTGSRPDITKFFWKYCKERELQDPDDKSFILADEALQALTGESRFKGFGFSKLIKQHFTGYA